MHRRLLLLALTVTALLTAAGIAYATIPDSGGVYTACMLTKTGTIRLIDPSLGSSSSLGYCTKNETQIKWNQTGATGAQGPAGKDAPKVLSGYVLGNGVLGAGSGFGMTAKRLGVGHYEVDFSAGTWDGKNSVVPVVNFSGGGGANGYAIVEGVTFNPDGSGDFTVVTVDAGVQQRADAIFYFQVTQSNGF